MRNVSRFRLQAHTLATESSFWRSRNGHCDKCSYATVQNEVHILFHCQDFLCALSEERTLSFSSLSANPFLWRPLLFHMPCLVRLPLVFFLNGTIDSAISFRTLWTIFWLAKTSNIPISLTTWLAVNPLTCNKDPHKEFHPGLWENGIMMAVQKLKCSSSTVWKSKLQPRKRERERGTLIQTLTFLHFHTGSALESLLRHPMPCYVESTQI